MRDEAGKGWRILKPGWVEILGDGFGLPMCLYTWMIGQAGIILRKTEMKHYSEGERL